MTSRNTLFATIIILTFCCHSYSSAEKIIDRKVRAFDYMSPDDITFLLFTRLDGKGEELKISDEETIKRSSFNSSNLTKIMTHGWQDNSQADFIAILKNEFLRNGKYNYISVDWSKCAFKAYGESLFCIKTVGRYIGLLIQKLADVTKLRFDDVHLLGHSLGAHTMGYVSIVFSNKEIGRITGLDPASPVFEAASPRNCLDASDAKIVDVIHTGLDTFGLKKPSGTINFYPNGGRNQPGCKPEDTYNDDCNHATSYLYFAETIPEKNRKKYIAKKCTSLDNALQGNCNGKDGVMGLDADKTDPGIYYIKTTSPPIPP